MLKFNILEKNLLKVPKFTYRNGIIMYEEIWTYVLVEITYLHFHKPLTTKFDTHIANTL